MQARPLLTTGALAELQKASSNRPEAQVLLRQIHLGGVDLPRHFRGDTNSDRFTKEPISFTDTEQLYAIRAIAMARVTSLHSY